SLRAALLCGLFRRAGHTHEGPQLLQRFSLPTRRSPIFQTGAERMPHDLSHLGFLAGQIGRLITISTTPVIAGHSFEMDAVGALRLSPLRRGLAIDRAVDFFTFYAPHRPATGDSRLTLIEAGSA